EDALTGFEDGPDEVVGQAFGGAVRTELSAFNSHQPGAIGAGPQAAVARDGETEYAVVADGGRVIAVVDKGTSGIEAHRASAGSDPEIAVGSLRECLDGVFGESVLRLPDAASVAFG